MAGRLASLTPISRNVMPFAASGAMSPRVCPGTSVILAPVVFVPKRRSRDCEIPIAPEISVGSINSVCQVNGSACHAM